MLCFARCLSLSIALMVLVGAWGCHTDLGIEEKRFECYDSSECMEGWTCGNDNICVEGSVVISQDDDECYAELTRSTCDSDEFCVRVGTELQCIKSQCSATNACSDGSECVKIAPQFAFCVPTGPRDIGQSCSFASGPYCTSGLICDGGSDGGSSCARICDPWASAPCDPSDACALRAPSLGTCQPKAESDGHPYATCRAADVGKSCGDAMVCLPLGGSQHRCVPWCRPGEGDCPQLQNGSDRLECNIDVLPGSSDVGLCLTPCSDSEGCPGKRVCTDAGGREAEFCRVPCEDDSDCPDYDGEASWVCVDGYCE